jgi:hypothetical protein
LTITISRVTPRYGFQLSSVVDANTTQAGTLQVPSGQGGRIHATALGGIQFAEHSIPSSSNTFTVNWIAPASASTGTVRFNVAGNAANNDLQPTGDFIYTQVYRVSPAAVAASPEITAISTTPVAPLANQSFSFTLTGSNFDTTSAGVIFTGPGCSAGCAAAITSRTVTQVSGMATLASGTFSLVAQNGGGAASNALPLAVPVIPFALSDHQGTSMISDGGGVQTTGYAEIQPTSGTTPSGVAIFGLRQNNVLVTEAGVPASPLLTPSVGGRIYAEVSGTQGTAGAVDTGFAIANPNNATANVNFFFTDANGVDTPAGQMTVAPNSQKAQFLDQAPFNSGTNFRGTFSFSADVPVSVIALRGYYNERPPTSEFLITTLPLVDLAAAPGAGTVYLAHFADGGGWTTQVILVNPTDTTLTGSIQFMGQGTSTTAATPVTLTANGQTNNTFTYSIPRRSSFKLLTSGAPAATLSGSVRVVPDAGKASPSGIAVFSFRNSGIVVSEAGVPGVGSANTFRMYVEESGAGINSGIAVTNTSASTANLTLNLYQLDGQLAGSAPLSIGGNGQKAAFLDQFFPGIALPFKGVLVVSGGASPIAVVSLRSRYNERNDFLITTTPATNEASAPSATQSLFPHLVNGSASGALYTTQFILFSGTAGQTSGGNLQFFNAVDGSALGLSVN